jgi:KDO2-lipid IV(A) lauroyltransferase
MYYSYLFARIFCLFCTRDVCYRIAKFLACIQYYLSKKDRASVINNLKPIIADQSELKACAKKVFINFAYYLVDFFRYARLDTAFVRKYVKVEGINYLEAAHKDKKGIIVVTAHLGNYELAGAVTSLLGYTVNAIALSHKDTRIKKFFDQQRGLLGIKVINAGVSTKKCFSLLKRGELIAFLGDRDFSGSGSKVNLFGQEQASLPLGPAFFALKTGASLIPAFFVRENSKFYRLIFEKPIPTQNLNQEEEIVEAYSLVLEKYIKRYPEQWYMFAPYWL